MSEREMTLVEFVSAKLPAEHLARRQLAQTIATLERYSNNIPGEDSDFCVVSKGHHGGEELFDICEIVDGECLTLGHIAKKQLADLLEVRK